MKGGRDCAPWQGAVVKHRRIFTEGILIMQEVVIEEGGGNTEW
jgi:hypothetical protein